MTAQLAKLAAVLLIVGLAWGIVGHMVKAAEALLPACELTSDGSQSPMCATPSNTPNR